MLGWGASPELCAHQARTLSTELHLQPVKVIHFKTRLVALDANNDRTTSELGVDSRASPAISPGRFVAVGKKV